jgi:hypothetical protein
LKLVIADLGESPPGIPGLARTTIALVIVTIVGLAVFHLLVICPTCMQGKETADKILTLLTGTLTSITGFYFGGKAAESAQKTALLATPPAPSQARDPNLPRVESVEPVPASINQEVTVSGKNLSRVDQIKLVSSDADHVITLPVTRTTAGARGVAAGRGPGRQLVVQGGEDRCVTAGGQYHGRLRSAQGSAE